MDPLSRTQVDPAQAGAQTASEPGADLRRLGDFRIMRRLGEGGMGSVYLAYKEGDDQQVALKVLNDQIATNQAYVDRFYREFRTGSVLNHPSIVHSISAGQDPATGKHYLVLEYVEGVSAQALLEKYGRLSVGDAVHIALDVARALEHAHSRNVIHRDIKPDNILITRSGVSKLTDLGLSKRIDEASNLTATRQGFGTPYYMPYEQAVDAKHADGRSDIYALGATLYHLLTGDVPFTGANPVEVVELKMKGDFRPASELNATVPRVLDQILTNMLAPFPKDRYQTASELIVDLERSRLAAPLLSFADPEMALQDPWVRACMASAGQPTQPDLAQYAASTPTPRDEVVEEPLWMVRYLAKDGRWRRVRLPFEQLLDRIRHGRVPPDSEACGDPREGFRPMSQFPEFAAILAQPQAEVAFSAAKPAPHRERPSRSLRVESDMDSLPPTRGYPLIFIVCLLTLLLGSLGLLFLLLFNEP